jgi:segregation and condensation protein A
MNFRIDLDSYRGPLDLLLYLVRKEEIDLFDIPVARITDQYLEYLSLLQVLNVDDVGEFIELASQLLEIKSQLLLPHGDEEVAPLEDPREGLVERLLEYKRYKDSASMLDERSRSWQQHCPRLANDVPPRRLDPADQPIRELELWDVVSAFGRIMRDNLATQPSNIVYDDTPIHVYMERLYERLRRGETVCLSQMFEPRMHKSAMIGVFLAILELVRHHCVRTEQSGLYGEILVLPDHNFPQSPDFSQADNYGGRRHDQPDSPSQVR